MPDAISRYNTWETDEMVRSVDPSFSFLVDTFFPAEKQFTTDFIEFDIVEHGRHLAPFVTPLSQGQPTRRKGFRTYQLKPAYIKMSFNVTPGDGFTRMAGEPYGGALTPRQRLDRAMAEQIATHDDMINNRLEWMASSALVNGTILVTGPDYPAVTVSFERNSNLAFTTGVAWATTATATPIDDIQTAADRINQYSRGAVADTIVMSGTAFSNASKVSQFRDLLDKNKNLSPGTGGFDLGPRSGTREAVYQGRLSGKFDLWTYDGYYEDDTGTSQRYVAVDKVIVASKSGLEGTKMFGAILDMESLVAQRHFVKTRTVWDPSAEELLSQSAPMINMRRPNTVAVIDVAP